jgi:hypothetical protein
MPTLHVDQLVRLKEDDPTHTLKRGEEGVVVSVWLSSGGLLCEVEFSNSAKLSPAVRALLRAQQLEVVE